MPKTEPAFRPLAATTFWVSLFGAAGLFAALALAPKLRTYRELSRDYDGLQRRLVSTEHRTERLAKVADALEHDPQFAAELARVDFDAPGSEERMPVGPQLSLPAWDANPANTEIATRPSSAALLDGPFLDTLSDDRRVRTPLMAASSLLVLVAFALCGERRPRRANDDREGENSDPTDRGIRGWLARRYGRADR